VPESATAGPSEVPIPELLVGQRDGVLTLTINRPERRNSMTWDVISSLRAEVARAKADPAVRVVVLTGSGEEAFCAGADLSGMVPRQPRGSTDEYADHHQARGWLAELFEELWSLGKPTVARVQGWAMAGGFGLALACDLVIASDRARTGAERRTMALHGDGAHAPVDASEEGPRADVDQPGSRSR
jgi:enoyl-CoA hydratase/carnithine racemase